VIVTFLTAFHVFNISDSENTALMVVATAAVGLGLYVYSLLTSWATATYDTSRATTLITAFVAAVIALLDAFGVFKFDGSQQSALLGVSGGIAFLGGLVFSYLHTSKQVLVRAQAVKAALDARQSGIGNPRQVPQRR
jgi:hypothetical protein